MPYSSAVMDPYVELDVPRNASHQEIKQAYRRIALASHPDHHAGDATAAERFRRASQSYALLRDPARRLTFDRTGRWDDDQWEPELDVALVEALEIFARDFGAAVEVPVSDDHAPAHTGRVTMAVDVNYDDVERGARRRIPAPCVLCSGSGAREGSAHVRCTACGGSGRLRQVENSLLGPRIHTESCGSCNGSGRRAILVCPGCAGSGRSVGGESLEVVIPRGTADGDSLVSVSGNGYRFVARLAEDQRWARDGADIYTTRRIPYEVAVLGGRVDVELPGRKHRVEVAAATASGHRVRIPGQGLPKRDGSGRGDLILTLHVTVPEKIGVVERWLLKARLARSGALTPSGRLTRLHAWAHRKSNHLWQQWREQQHASSLRRVERTAASLRSAAKLVSESEQRLGPLLELGFLLIAPEAARARARLNGARRRHAALTDFAMDCILATGLLLGLGFLAWYADPAIAAAGNGVWWRVLRRVDPLVFALAPMASGIGMAFVRAKLSRRELRIAGALPLGMIAGATVVATALAVYVTIRYMEPGSGVMAVVGTLAALAACVVPVSVFLLGETMVGKLKNMVQESAIRADRNTLRKFDVAAARLATQLEGTERAFRQLLTQADDARHPLTSLLNGAADTLTNDGQRRVRSTARGAAVALASALGITVVWLAASFIAVAGTFGMRPEAGLWQHVAAGIVTAGACTLPIALSARLRAYVRGAGNALALAACSALAFVLAPIALASALRNRPS